MSKRKSPSNLIKFLRWAARILSLLVLVLAIAILITPGTEVEGQTPSVAYWLLLILWCMGVLGLLMAWRWELAGGFLAILSLIVRDIFLFFLGDRFFMNFGQVWLPILIPASLFLLVWWMEKKARERME